MKPRSSISRSDWRALGALKDLDSASLARPVVAIAERLGARRQHVWRSLAALLEAGLVEKSRTWGGWKAVDADVVAGPYIKENPMTLNEAIKQIQRKYVRVRNRQGNGGDKYTPLADAFGQTYEDWFSAANGGSVEHGGTRRTYRIVAKKLYAAFVPVTYVSAYIESVAKWRASVGGLLLHHAMSAGCVEHFAAKHLGVVQADWHAVAVKLHELGFPCTEARAMSHYAKARGLATPMDGFDDDIREALLSVYPNGLPQGRNGVVEPLYDAFCEEHSREARKFADARDAQQKAEREAKAAAPHPQQAIMDRILDAVPLAGWVDACNQHGIDYDDLEERQHVRQMAARFGGPRKPPPRLLTELETLRAMGVSEEILKANGHIR